MAKCDICGKGVHFGNNVKAILIEEATQFGTLMLRALSAKVNGGARKNACLHQLLKIW